jgi:hypothetical protein
VTELRTTEKGRIWSYNDPSLGATANAAFIATAYAVYLKPLGDPKARTYTCWAQQQVEPPHHHHHHHHPVTLPVLLGLKYDRIASTSGVVQLKRIPAS